ncbi:MAG: hypothetical protein HZC28_13350 [Spirochaetes bacterium]|nr:hypothetical protein [Spirochaetota bacterium]
MKKVTILVPDEITYVKGTGSGSVRVKEATTADAILGALTMNDYHCNYFFEDRETIQIVAIEDASSRRK